MLLLRRFLVLRGRCGGLVLFCGVVDGEGERCGGPDGDNARAELDANGDIVVGGEPAFTEANGELVEGQY